MVNEYDCWGGRIPLLSEEIIRLDAQRVCPSKDVRNATPDFPIYVCLKHSVSRVALSHAANLQLKNKRATLSY